MLHYTLHIIEILCNMDNQQNILENKKFTEISWNHFNLTFCYTTNILIASQTGHTSSLMKNNH